MKVEGSRKGNSRRGTTNSTLCLQVRGRDIKGGRSNGPGPAQRRRRARHEEGASGTVVYGLQANRKV